MKWTDIPGRFRRRTGQEEAERHFPAGSRFVEVGCWPEMVSTVGERLPIARPWPVAQWRLVLS